ncbi:MAG TPA: type 1 glutamine amidotransferase family protein [Gemmatimonadaceae bacterium]|nr:type 1 glutamine amidotransferase family protein [Gemmatimonadaceae bacterium]
MSGTRAVYFLVFDGFADWEAANALAELRRWGHRTVRVVGFTSVPVVSMGGLRITPDLALDEVAADDVELLLLPGGDMWEKPTYPRGILETLIARLIENERPIAAICGATLALGRAGALDERRHTSNMRSYLSEHAPEYAGASHYVEAPAVRDRHLITASGLAPVDFAREIFAELEIFDADNAALWYAMFKDGRLPEGVV